MGERSGDCQRPGICLEASGRVRAESELHNEIDFTLTLRRTKHCWWTKGGGVSFQKRKGGWVVFTYSDPIRKAFEEYGLIHLLASTSIYDPTYFPSLKAARQAVSDVSLEAGLNIDPRLTRQKFISYKLGDLPLIIKRQKGYWRTHSIFSSALSQSLQKHFNTTQEFLVAWESTDSAFAHHPTRKSAHQAVKNWFTQTIIEGK